MALVTLANVKTYLGITDNTKDDLLNLLIEMASDFIETKTQMIFESTVYTQEEYDGTGTRELVLKHFPVTEFTLLEINDASDNTDNWRTIDSNNYWVDMDKGIITKTSNFLEWNDDVKEGLSPDVIFYTGKNRYRVTYTAGYADIPSDIQLVTMQVISYFFNKRKLAGLKSESLGDHSITFEDALNENNGLNEIINSYRDIPLCQ